MDNILEYQRELFSLLDEFFQRATGKTPRRFASLDRFSETVPSLAARAPQVENAWEWAIPQLRDLYVRNGANPFAAATRQGGIKVVLGGSSRFGKTQLNAARRLALYADTVLIPDPIFAWLETERPEERFRHVQVLEAMFFLLRLKPFVDSDFGYPPVLVFPSFDRLLSKHDPATQASESRFVAGTLSSLLEQDFSSVEEVANNDIESQRKHGTSLRKLLQNHPGVKLGVDSWPTAISQPLGGAEPSPPQTKPRTLNRRSLLRFLCASAPLRWEGGGARVFSAEISPAGRPYSWCPALWFL